jgi:hypothetical protein
VALVLNKTLKALNLSSNNIKKKGAILIGDVLIVN